MKMRLTGEIVIPMGPEQVWPLLLDHEFIRHCAEGMDSIERVHDTHFLATTEVALGPITLTFPLDVHLRDLERPRTATMEITGEAPGIVVSTTSTVTLSPNDAGTRLRWESRSEARGPVTIVAGRPLRHLTERRAREFWDAFVREAPGRAAGRAS